MQEVLCEIGDKDIYGPAVYEYRRDVGRIVRIAFEDLYCLVCFEHRI